jgi:hypothetical protein
MSFSLLFGRKAIQDICVRHIYTFFLILELDPDFIPDFIPILRSCRLTGPASHHSGACEIRHAFLQG